VEKLRVVQVIYAETFDENDKGIKGGIYYDPLMGQERKFRNCREGMKHVPLAKK